MRISKLSYSFICLFLFVSHVQAGQLESLLEFDVPIAETPWCELEPPGVVETPLARTWTARRPPHCGAPCLMGWQSPRETRSFHGYSRFTRGTEREVVRLCPMSQPSIEFDICKMLVESGLFREEEILKIFAADENLP